MAAPKAGVAQREHLEALLTSGNAAARAKAAKMLKGPKCPEEFAYLREWLYQLYGRSGVGGMGDTAPLSWREIHAWAEFHGLRPSPDELDALMLLDSVLRKATSESREQDAPKRPARGRG